MKDVAWFQFFNILFYKAEEAGRTIVKVPAKGTSQICSQCGKEVPKTLDVRVHNCPHCNCSLDRDYNSALNILRVGLTLSDNPTPVVSSLEATLL
jgi:putative transposase